MECHCSPYDPDVFGVTLSVTRHRGATRKIVTGDIENTMLLLSWRYWESRGLSNPFERGKKEVAPLVAEPELRSQINVPPPAVESIAAIVTAKKKPPVKLVAKTKRKPSVNKGEDDGR